MTPLCKKRGDEDDIRLTTLDASPRMDCFYGTISPPLTVQQERQVAPCIHLGTAGVLVVYFLSGRTLSDLIRQSRCQCFQSVVLSERGSNHRDLHHSASSSKVSL